MVLASGGQDGAICLWDVLTGSRVSHVYGHRGDVTSLVCTTSCVISSGLDDLICVWDRSTGIKLYSIQQVRNKTTAISSFISLSVIGQKLGSVPVGVFKPNQMHTFIKALELRG